MSFRIRFKVRTKKRTSKTELHYIYCRLRVDAKPAPDFGTGIGCKFADWDNKAQRIRGNSEVVRQQNLKLDQIRAELETLYNELRKSDKPISAQIIKQYYTKKTPTTAACLLAYYQLYIDKELNGIVEEPTVKKWGYRKTALENYLKHLKRKDVELAEVTPKWVKEYYNYHVNQLNHAKNHAARLVQAIKRVMDYAVENEALPYNATRSLKVARDKPKPIKYLTTTQLEMLAACPYYDERRLSFSGTLFSANKSACFIFHGFIFSFVDTKPHRR